MGHRGMWWASVALPGLAACADVPADAEPAGRRADTIQMGTKVEAVDALLDGVVRLDAPKKDALLGADARHCTATVIGPRVLLTAEHCVRTYDPGTKKWGAMKQSTTPRVPDGSTNSNLYGTPNLWSAGSCGLGGPVLVPLDGLSSAPKFSVLRPFNLGTVVRSRLANRKLLATKLLPGCGVESMTTPRADVAIIRLPEGAPAYAWPTRTGLDGGPTTAHMDKGTKTECAGYGLDHLPRAGETGGAGFAKAGMVKLIANVGWFPDTVTKQPSVLPPGGVGLIPHAFVNATTPGQLPDHGDSGCGCVVRPEDDFVARRVVGVATEARREEDDGPVLLGFAARADVILPWVERVAYTKPDSFDPPVDTVITKPAIPAEDWDWDDGRNFFADMNGDGLDDFIYFGDKKNIHVQHATGDGKFGVTFTSPGDHSADIYLTALAKWPGPPGSTPSARGYRSQLVTSYPKTSFGYEGADITIRFHDGTAERVRYAQVPGPAWQSLVSVDAGPHFNPVGDALIVQRKQDPAVPGDFGSVALLQPEPTGGFFPPQQFWAFPGETYKDAAFLVADIDGDGAVELIADKGKWYHVFRGLPGDTPWSSTPILLQVPQGCSHNIGGRKSLADVTGDKRADLVCVNDKETGIFVLRGTEQLQFETDVPTPFEISGYRNEPQGIHLHPWGDAILSDLDGDGFRDYVTFFDNALWFKLNNAKGKPLTSKGEFGVIQRFDMPPALRTTFGASFDTPHVRPDVPRSVVVVAYRMDKVPVIREMASWPKQDR